MTNKTIIAGLVALAFLTGSIMTTSMAYAADKPNGKPFQALWDAIEDIQTQIDDIELAPGPQGEQGEPGITNVYQVISTSTCADANACQVVADCNTGDIVIGGGVAGNSNSRVFQNEPLDGDSWIGGILQSLPPTASMNVTAICASIP